MSLKLSGRGLLLSGKNMVLTDCVDNPAPPLPCQSMYSENRTLLEGDILRAYAVDNTPNEIKATIKFSDGTQMVIFCYLVNTSDGADYHYEGFCHNYTARIMLRCSERSLTVYDNGSLVARFATSGPHTSTNWNSYNSISGSITRGYIDTSSLGVKSNDGPCLNPTDQTYQRFGDDTLLASWTLNYSAVYPPGFYTLGTGEFSAVAIFKGGRSFSGSSSGSAVVTRGSWLNNAGEELEFGWKFTIGCSGGETSEFDQVLFYRNGELASPYTSWWSGYDPARLVVGCDSYSVSTGVTHSVPSLSTDVKIFRYSDDFTGCSTSRGWTTINSPAVSCSNSIDTISCPNKTFSLSDYRPCSSLNVSGAFVLGERVWNGSSWDWLPITGGNVTQGGTLSAMSSSGIVAGTSIPWMSSSWSATFTVI